MTLVCRPLLVLAALVAFATSVMSLFVTPLDAAGGISSADVQKFPSRREIKCDTKLGNVVVPSDRRDRVHVAMKPADGREIHVSLADLHTTPTVITHPRHQLGLAVKVNSPQIIARLHAHAPAATQGISLFFLGAFLLQVIIFVGTYFHSPEWIFNPLFLLLLMAVISIAAYKPLDWLFSEIFKRYLFKKKSYTHMALMHLAEDLRLVLSLQELGNLVVNTFGEILHLKTAALVLPSDPKGHFRIASAFGWHVSDYRKVQLSSNLCGK